MNKVEEAVVQLKLNDQAPDFTLNSHNEGELNLAWYIGRKNIVLAFYPGDWTPVCAHQIPEYQKLIHKFEEHNCQLLCVSVDSVPCHKAWARSLGGLSYPLMSDFYPHGQVSRKYGVFDEKRGFSLRSVFLIDIEGKIRFIEHINLAKMPDNDLLFKELAKL